jgi:hypothetical protein
MPKKPISKSLSAKKKLKAHLEKTTDVAFTPTEPVTWYWWRVINKAVFQDQLPHPSKIVIKKMRDAYGLCQANAKNNSCTITVSTIHITTRKLFLSTLCHEMCHQWQFHFGTGSLDHGANFKQWSEYFRKRFGIIL